MCYIRAEIRAFLSPPLIEPDVYCPFVGKKIVSDMCILRKYIMDLIAMLLYIIH